MATKQKHNTICVGLHYSQRNILVSLMYSQFQDAVNIIYVWYA